jgi:hypothetical protein
MPSSRISLASARRTETQRVGELRVRLTLGYQGGHRPPYLVAERFCEPAHVDPDVLLRMTRVREGDLRGDGREEAIHHDRRPVGPPAVDGGLGDPGPLRDRLHRHRGEPLALEQLVGGSQDRPARPLAARSARWSGLRVILCGLPHGSHTSSLWWWG